MQRRENIERIIEQLKEDDEHMRRRLLSFFQR